MLPRPPACQKDFFDKLKPLKRMLRRLQAVKKPTESSRGPKPSRILIVPGGVYGGCGRIFAAENLIFQSKNRFLADFAPGDFEEILAKSGRGGRKAENPLDFQVLPLAKLPRLKSKI